jgi:hypothetical protein
MSNPFAEIERKLERIPARLADVERLLEKMEHDLATAEDIRERAPDWTLKIAHQAVLDGCTALVAAHGYRARVNGHHYVTIRFAQLTLPEHTALLDRAEMLRRRRHEVTYGGVYVVSEEEVEGALDLARQLAPVLRASALAALGPAGTSALSDPC